MATRPPLDDLAFRLLRDLIHEHTGLQFDDDSRRRLERCLAPRLAELRLGDFVEYHRHLRLAPTRRQELEHLVERVTTNETYFFREQYQLDALRLEILPLLARQRPRGRRLVLWSAGCSTGEEPYTLAILILDSGLFVGWDVQVIGTDISRRVLTVARQGEYSGASFRQTEERYLRQYFRPAGARYQLVPQVRALVSFAQLNLVDRSAYALLGECDVILCRNVLMYLAPAARRLVLGGFLEQLTRGGYLLLGHSESLLNLSTAFELVDLEHDLVYRRP